MRPTLALLMLVLLPTAHATTLTYEADNKWVAQVQAEPLRQLQAQARAGTTRFTATLPPADRALSAARLQILHAMLEREAKTPVLITEAASGTAAPNTLTLQPAAD